MEFRTHYTTLNMGRRLWLLQPCAVLLNDGDVGDATGLVVRLFRETGNLLPLPRQFKDALRQVFISVAEPELLDAAGYNTPQHFAPPPAAAEPAPMDDAGSSGDGVESDPWLTDAD